MKDFCKMYFWILGKKINVPSVSQRIYHLINSAGLSSWCFCLSLQIDYTIVFFSFKLIFWLFVKDIQFCQVHHLNKLLIKLVGTKNLSEQVDKEIMIDMHIHFN